MKATKYVMNQSGEIVIGSELLGLVHPQMSRDFLDGSQETSAGFIYWDEETQQFVVYGRSTGLDLGCNPFAANAITDAFRDGKLIAAPLDEDRDRWVAGTFQHEDSRVVKDISTLRKLKILTD